MPATPRHACDEETDLSLIKRLRGWARTLRRDVVALWLAARDPRTPWYAKAVVGAVVAYAMSPIDLIPDFIPVIGYLDDLILVPLGIALAVRLIPPALLAECRAAADSDTRLPLNRAAGAVIVILWVAGMAALVWWAWTNAAWRGRAH